MHSKVTLAACWLLVLALVVAFPACKSKDTIPLDTSYGDGTDLDTGVDDREVTTVEGLPDIDQEKLLWDRDTGLQPVYFDFDSYTLHQDARQTLEANADKIRKAPGVFIQVEGHCDERGTQEYNLALGEKRALAAREYLIKLGVSGDRIITISYGEEMPADPGRTESAYAKNRRCEFNKAM